MRYQNGINLYPRDCARAGENPAFSERPDQPRNP